jgi:hypothetical protein
VPASHDNLVMVDSSHAPLSLLAASPVSAFKFKVWLVDNEVAALSTKIIRSFPFNGS